MSFSSYSEDGFINTNSPIQASLWNDMSILNILTKTSSKENESRQTKNAHSHKTSVDDEVTNTSIWKNSINGVDDLRIPLTRIRRIMKDDFFSGGLSQEAVFVMGKATELFIESMVAESYEHMKVNKKRTITSKDVETTVKNIDSLGFLLGLLEK